MLGSVVAAAKARGIEDDDVASLRGAVVMAMEPRVSLLADDHDPAFLHPGRSVLILLRDVGVVASRGLVVAAVLESEDDHLRVAPWRLRSELGEAVPACVDSIPRPGDERLVERLIELETDLALAALAERLDHLRHLHVRPDLGAVWTARRDEVVNAWLPFARRTHDLLGTRFEHWTRTFARRL